MTLTVFYDGTCPLCVAEMKLLSQYDSTCRLRLEDIHKPDFKGRYPEVDVHAANQILHGQNSDGSMLYGLDVTVKAWGLVGKKPWLKALRWPVIRWFADKAYVFFAKHRMGISRFFMGQRCTEQGACSMNKPASKNCARNVNEDAEF